MADTKTQIINDNQLHNIWQQLILDGWRLSSVTFNEDAYIEYGNVIKVTLKYMPWIVNNDGGNEGKRVIYWDKDKEFVKPNVAAFAGLQIVSAYLYTVGEGQRYRLGIAYDCALDLDKANA
jgi:hypothetical protein